MSIAPAATSASLSPTFLSVCAKLRANDPSVLPGRNKYFEIRGGLSAGHIEIVEALTKNTTVLRLRLDLIDLCYSANAADVMGECIRSSMHLQSLYLNLSLNPTIWSIRRRVPTESWRRVLSLPEIRKSQQIHFELCPGLLSAMPSLLEGLRDNSSLVQFNISRSTKWALGSAIRAPLETFPPLAFWAPALARVSMLPDVLFCVFRSKAAIVSYELREKRRQRNL
jgi:hypothetical protein